MSSDSAKYGLCGARLSKVRAPNRKSTNHTTVARRDAPINSTPPRPARHRATHTGGVSHEARRNVARVAAEQIAGLLAGNRPPRLVNPEVWPRCEKRRAQLLR